MSIFEAFILGLVQGITEYLPVSSSAHLIIVPHILGWQAQPEHFAFDLLVQIGTLFGVIAYFWQEIKDITSDTLSAILSKKPFASENARFAWMVVLATIPAAFTGLIFKDQIKSLFNSPKSAMFFLLITAIILLIGELYGKKIKNTINVKNSVLIGLSQAMALLPGISRSGTTISVAMLGGGSRQIAAKFSFFMSIPIMIGASIVAIDDLLAQPQLLGQMWQAIVVGFCAAAISGYFVIKWFLAYLKTKSLFIFSGYCAIMGTVGIIFF